MKEKELDIDWKKHVCYSKAVKKIIREELRKKSKNNDEMEYMWEKVQQKYVEYLKDQSYLGGKKSGHNAAGGTYDCIAILAYYEVMDRKPSIEEIYQMNKELLLPSFAALGKIFNVNHPWQLRLLNKIFEQTAKRDKKMEKDLPEGYRMRTEPYQKDTGYIIDLNVVRLRSLLKSTIYWKSCRQFATVIIRLLHYCMQDLSEHQLVQTGMFVITGLWVIKVNT